MPFPIPLLIKTILITFHFSTHLPRTAQSYFPFNSEDSPPIWFKLPLPGAAEGAGRGGVAGGTAGVVCLHL